MAHYTDPEVLAYTSTEDLIELAADRSLTSQELSAISQELARRGGQDEIAERAANPGSMRATAGSRSGELQNLAKTQRVMLANIDMPFGSMVKFMVVWALASVPAFIILALLAFVAFSFVRLLLG